MSVYRYSKVICIVQILLLLKSNESLIALFNGINVIHFAVLLLTIWSLKTSSTAVWILSRKKTNECEILDVFSVLQTILEQIFVLRLFDIVFYKQQWKIVSFWHNFHLWFWKSQETTKHHCIMQTSLKASPVSKIRSVVWFLTVYCDWYNMPSVNKRNSRSPDINSFKKKTYI